VSVLSYFCFCFISCNSSLFVQIAYLDFVDFNGNVGTIDYRLPRMRYIKNQDFLHLQRFDLRVEKRKYGRLPVSIFEANIYSFTAFLYMI
jgi:hypothetical protein